MHWDLWPLVLIFACTFFYLFFWLSAWITNKTVNNNFNFDYRTLVLGNQRVKLVNVVLIHQHQQMWLAEDLQNWVNFPIWFCWVIIAMVQSITIAVHLLSTNGTFLRQATVLLVNLELQCKILILLAHRLKNQNIDPNFSRPILVAPRALHNLRLYSLYLELTPCFTEHLYNICRTL